MSILKNCDKNITLFIKAKKVLIQRLVFSKLPTNLIQSLITFFKLTFIEIFKEAITQTLMIQIAIKAFSLDKINFSIL